MARKTKMVQVLNISKKSISDGKRMIAPNETVDVTVPISKILIEHGYCELVKAVPNPDDPTNDQIDIETE